MKKNYILIICVLLLGFSINIKGNNPTGKKYYIKHKTWVKTLLESRKKLQKSLPDIKYGNWYTAGPIELQKRDKNKKDFPYDYLEIKDKITWIKQDGWEKGRNLTIKNTNNKNYVVYMTYEINVDRPYSVHMQLQSSKIKKVDVFFNSNLLPGPKKYKKYNESYKLYLKKGRNLVYVKIYNSKTGNIKFKFDYFADEIQALWNYIRRDFSGESTFFIQDMGFNKIYDWFKCSHSNYENSIIKRLLKEINDYDGKYAARFEKMRKSDLSHNDPVWLEFYLELNEEKSQLMAMKNKTKLINFPALRRAFLDLTGSAPHLYPDKEKVLNKISEYEKLLPELMKKNDKKTDKKINEIIAFKRKILFSNPVLDFDEILLIQRNIGAPARKEMGKKIGLAPANHQTYDNLNPIGWDNEIVLLSDYKKNGKADTLYKPEEKKIIADIDLHFDAERILFASAGTHDLWHVFEISINGKNLQQLTPADLDDVSHFDACYLPNDNIIFISTAAYQGLPCTGGGSSMALMYLLNRKTSKIRQLTFEQDSDWTPAVLNNGRILYLRWEYTDLPHYFSRILFHANPDGTEQLEYYGSGSYFPNGLFCALPLPGHPTKIVGIASGHHGISRSGRMLIIDPMKGRNEANGVIQEVPGYGKKVEAIIKDGLVNGVWPQITYPYPLNEKYFLVSAKIDSRSLWGIYLVDIFDNFTLLKEVEGAALVEPIPLKKRTRPPIIPEKVDLTKKDATVYMADIYSGPGLADVPVGRVKNLRLFSYHFNYNKNGGHTSVGVESSWDIKRVLGTVPIEKDGSATFKIPANTPISMQPLDEDGATMQIMRSWFVGQPGEIVSCVGCHENQNQIPPIKQTIASRKAPSDIQPWYGPARPFSYHMEVQPVLDKYCISCHSGNNYKGKEIIDLTDNDFNSRQPGQFSSSYMALNPFVRRPGPESEMLMFHPMEYYVNTSELFQILNKNHHNVKLDDEAWSRLNTWADLNAPYRGKWDPPEFNGYNQRERRLEFQKLYALHDTDVEGEYDKWFDSFLKKDKPEPVIPAPMKEEYYKPLKVKGWPFDRKKAQLMQSKLRSKIKWPSKNKGVIDLGNNIIIKMVHIPSGEFIMGSSSGYDDEKSVRKAKIAKPFWMSVCEIRNIEYNQFDPAHNSRFIDQQWKDHTTPGYPANQPDQPVIRISWNHAMAFCKWMKKKTGLNVTLPTETQWEWTCRAGTSTPFFYGPYDTDFSLYANLADLSIRLLAVKGVNPKPADNPSPIMDFIPRNPLFSDKEKIVTEVGKYMPNAWGLYDMHGNVAEWTRSTYIPYEGAKKDKELKVARGGSWRDRPKRATSSFKNAYYLWQRVYNVGFRIIIEE